MALLNLEDQLVFYRKYHHNTINVLIHAVFVPTILFASIGLANNYNIIYTNIPLGHFAILIYSVIYLLLDLRVGLLSLPILSTITISSNSLLHSVEGFNKTLIGLFVVGWIVQFIGHGVFEKRAPALLDNLFQALILAPIFVLFELLFVLGFRRQLHYNVDKRVGLKVSQYKR